MLLMFSAWISFRTYGKIVGDLRRIYPHLVIHNFGNTQRMRCALPIYPHCLALKLAAIKPLFLQLCHTLILFKLCISPNVWYHHGFSKFCTPSVWSIRPDVMLRHVNVTRCPTGATERVYISWERSRETMASFLALITPQLLYHYNVFQ